jgi:hypothetical protein
LYAIILLLAVLTASALPWTRRLKGGAAWFLAVGVFGAAPLLFVGHFLFDKEWRFLQQAHLANYDLPRGFTCIATCDYVEQRNEKVRKKYGPDDGRSKAVENIQFSIKVPGLLETFEAVGVGRSGDEEFDQRVTQTLGVLERLGYRSALFWSHLVSGAFYSIPRRAVVEEGGGKILLIEGSKVARSVVAHLGPGHKIEKYVVSNDDTTFVIEPDFIPTSKGWLVTSMDIKVVDLKERSKGILKVGIEYERVKGVQLPTRFDITAEGKKDGKLFREKYGFLPKGHQLL